MITDDKKSILERVNFFVLFSFDLTQVYNFIRQVRLILQNSYCGNIIYFLCQNFNRTTLLIYQTRLYKLQTRIIYFQTRINYIIPLNGTDFQTFFAPLFFFCNWFLLIWNGFYTSKISLLNLKLTFISSSGCWLFSHVQSHLNY